MMMNRRELVTVMGAAVLAARGSAVADAPGPPDAGVRHETDTIPHATLADAMTAAGFDARSSDAFTAIFTADVHYGTGDPEKILPPVFTEVNRMDPLPAFFAVAGDLICKASLRFGDVPSVRQRNEAVEEFRLLKRALTGLDRRVSLKLALGNHDTYPGEANPRLFHSVFPEHPEYHAFSVKGVSFVFLNGGANGAPGYEQRLWFRQWVQKRHRPGGTTVTVIHQPSLGSTVKERGVTQTIRECLDGVTGDLWTIGGHEHRNATDCFRFPKGAVVSQATITKGNPAVWGEEPGYWVWCFQGGRLAARIFRRVGQGFVVVAAPPIDRAAPLLLPFEGRDGEVLWKVLVGEGDTPFLVEHAAAWCLNYWYDNKHLTYRFPLDLAGPAAKRLCVLAASGGRPELRCLVGPDLRRLSHVEFAERDGSYGFINIPETCRSAGSVTVRLEGGVVSGFALTT